MGSQLWAAGMLLGLAGCYADQPSSAPVYGYAASQGYTSPDYPTPAYPTQAYPGDPPPGYPMQPDYPPPDYPSYSYNNGAPTIIAGGAVVPLVVFGGEWGYYDSGRHFHRAPDAVYHDLQRRQAFNRPPNPGPIPAGRPDWRAPGGQPYGGPPVGQPPGPQGPQHPFVGGGGPVGFRPPEPPSARSGHAFPGGAAPAPTRVAPPPHAAPPPPRPAHPFPGG